MAAILKRDTLIIDPMRPGFVARVTGVDLRKPLDETVIRAIEQAIWTYAVLVFPDQALSVDEQVAFGQHFGSLDTGLQEKLLGKVQTRLGSDAVSDISNVSADGSVADRRHKQAMMNVGNQFWHTDSSYEHHPFRYSILAAQCAVSWGGDTEFADLRAAWDELDARTREYIADRTGVFFSHNTRRWLGIDDTAEDLAAYPPVRWPLIRTHPETGRKVLWIDSKVCEISGLSVPEGRALAHELLEHIGQRERVYAHSWAAGDVVMWDNRSVLHRGRRFDMAERREMRRVSTVDDAASLASPGEGEHRAVTLTICDHR